MLNTIYNTDCEMGINYLDANSIDMIFTSPPYAEQRKNVYGGIDKNDYINWFVPICRSLYHKLKDNGSFFLNIKEHSENGFRDLYVLRLIIAITEHTDFKLVDTFAWTKNPYPSKQINKFKNGWEPIYHFAKQKNIKFYPQRVAEPIKEETLKRANRQQVGISENGSGFSQPDLYTIRKMTTSLPSNHIHINNIQNQFSKNKWHPAVFPTKLVEFFIKTYTDIDDIVLDPFIGSGTTAVVARELSRNFIGFEKSKIYCDKIKETYGIEISELPKMYWPEQ